MRIAVGVTLVLVILGLGVPIALTQTSITQSSSRRECAICHLSWVDAFDRPRGVLLVDLPDEAVVADSLTCLGCHDGSVADSRKRVWLEHGHRTGMTPPETMQVPDYLPLVDGTVACRTCHSAHGAGRDTDIAEAVFLRVPNDASQLCQACHADKTKGPELGTHPVGGMPWPVPDALIAAGARISADRSRLTCEVCHIAHGTPEEQLLVMGVDSSQLCLTCHDKLRPGMWLPDVEREHPQNPPLANDQQRQAIVEMGTRVGTGDTLICLSCHKLHHGQGDRNMLADTLEESRFCLRCHPERQHIMASLHDLRESAPDERNRLGQTAEQSGPCGACHSFHQFARRPEPRPSDPTGMCATCHQQGQCAERLTGLPLSHPATVDPARMSSGSSLNLFQATDDPSAKSLACLTCHDPHNTDASHFIRMTGDALCAQCHQTQADSLAAPHDLTGQADLLNGRGRGIAEVGRCGFCHAVHDAIGPAMWVATKESPLSPDGLCTACHQAGGVAATKSMPPYGHPTGPATAEPVAKVGTTMPLFNAQCRRTDDGFVACASCHNPHGSAATSPALLNVSPASQLCANCHAQPARLSGGLHDVSVKPAAWPDVAQAKADACLACHEVHSDVSPEMLWTAGVVAGFEPTDGACLKCHPHTQWSGEDVTPQPGATIHPRRVAQAMALHHQPLVPSGAGTVPDTIGCDACHDPHAPPGGSPYILWAGTSPEPGSMCLRCHQEVQYIGMSLHSHEALVAHPQTTQACGPCHVVHAEPGATTRDLWDGPVGPETFPPGTRRCMGCHSPSGSASTVQWFEHPGGVLQNAARSGEPGFMPVVDAAGAISAQGRLACITCHMTHGRPPDESMPAIDPTKVDRTRLAAMMPMLRPYVAPNLCSSCHGFDGIRRYLYFHQPEKRRGILAPPSASRGAAG